MTRRPRACDPAARGGRSRLHDRGSRSGLFGLTSTTRSASSGTRSGRRAQPSLASRITRVTGVPAARSAASASVKVGCRQAACRARRACASSQKPSQAPLRGSVSATGRRWRAAIASRAGRSSGYPAALEGVDQGSAQSRGALGRPDVDGEVEHPRSREAIPVQTQALCGRAAHRSTQDREERAARSLPLGRRPRTAARHDRCRRPWASGRPRGAERCSRRAS